MADIHIANAIVAQHKHNNRQEINFDIVLIHQFAAICCPYPEAFTSAGDFLFAIAQGMRQVAGGDELSDTQSSMVCSHGFENKNIRYRFEYFKMVKVWFMDNETSDQRLEHHRNPPSFLTLEDLFKKTGVEYFQINAENYKQDAVLAELRKKRNYSYEDEITCSEKCLPDYETKLKSFFTEHLHTDEEIRLVLDGSGYFDVRDAEENWIRIAVFTGDLIIIPAGIYHRFTLDSNNYVKAKRYFVGEPIWLPYNRPADDMDCRKEYLKQQSSAFNQANV